MDWQALRLSILLGLCTAALLIPVGIPAARAIAWNRFFGRSVLQSVIALPLILPPTVLGYYLLILFGTRSPIGRGYESLFHEPLVFSFQGILLASLIFNIPFVLQPM
ncbi:MAG: molybdate ABC transporter permease subunit, partial [Gammaproteobacteria bacterium]